MNEIRYDWSETEYRAFKAVCQSDLKPLRDRTPYYAKWKRSQPSTSSQQFGSAVHSAILEPGEYKRLYGEAGQCQGFKKDKTQCSRTGVNRFEGSWFCSQHSPQGIEPDSLIRLKPDEVGSINRIIEHASDIKSLKNLLKGEHECSAFWVDPLTGLQCKGRFDVFSKVGNSYAIADLKTSRDIREHWFSRDVVTYGYHIQAAMYRRGIQVLGYPTEGFIFYIIAVDSAPPNEIIIYEFAGTAIDQGELELDGLLAKYKTCVDENNWPSYGEEIHSLDIPQWAYTND